MCLRESNSFLTKPNLEEVEELRNSIYDNSCYFLNEISRNDIEHAYNAFKISNGRKPKFEEVYRSVYEFSNPIYSGICTGNIHNCLWDKEELEWKEKI